MSTDNSREPNLTEGEVKKEFFDAARQGDLLIQHCRTCDAYQYFPRTICHHCQSVDVEWFRSTKRGTVYSYSDVFRPTTPGDDTQFSILLVTLEEGPRAMCRAARGLTGTMSVGDDVDLDFEALVDSEDIQLVARPRGSAPEIGD